MPANPSGLPRDVADAERSRLAPRRADLERRLAGAATMTDPLDVYLNVSLACAPIFQRQLPDPEVVAAPAAHCTRSCNGGSRSAAGRHEDALRAFAAAHPRYVEADYWRGRYRSALVGEPASRREARERMRRRSTGDPRFAGDRLRPGRRRCASPVPRDALPLYERVTRAQPRHAEAWLGQGICHTYLEQPREAIEALSHVVDLGRWFVGDAYYWRAWNRHALRELDAAWADSERARQTIYGTDVFALSGRIAFDRKELDVARPLLEKAIELAANNCGATWYLGLTHSTQERWLDGGQVFERAETCYRDDVQRIRNELQLNTAGETDEAVRADRQVKADAAILAAERQAALAAYNAAFNFVRGGEPAKSRPLLDRAIQHADVTDRARELRAFVDR